MLLSPLTQSASADGKGAGSEHQDTSGTPQYSVLWRTRCSGVQQLSLPNRLWELS